MITADNVTDEQIRKLRAELRRIVKTEKYDELRREEARADEATCTVALTDRRAMAFMMEGVAQGVSRARARCAEILNARTARK